MKKWTKSLSVFGKN